MKKSMLAINTETYHCHRVAENDYFFRTKDNNVFSIKFSPYWQGDLLPYYSGIDTKMFELFFEIIELKKQKFDLKVALTVVKMVDEFLMKGNRGIFFTALRDDGRTASLAKVYHSWFKRYSCLHEVVFYFQRYLFCPDGDEIFFTCGINDEQNFENRTIVETIMEQVLKEIFPGTEITELENKVALSS